MTLPPDFTDARKILELAEKQLAQEKGSIIQPPQSLQEALALNIAKAFEDDTTEENEE